MVGLFHWSKTLSTVSNRCENAEKLSLQVIIVRSTHEYREDDSGLFNSDVPCRSPFFAPQRGCLRHSKANHSDRHCRSISVRKSARLSHATIEEFCRIDNSNPGRSGCSIGIEPTWL